MANKTQILDKIERNMGQRGLAGNLTRTDADTITITGGANDLVITYDETTGGSKNGGPSSIRGVSDADSPFLGIGNAGAGTIRMESAGGALTAVLDTVDKITAFSEASGFANDIVLEHSGGDTRIRGQADVLGLGE
jgi:hypothetical protein